MTALRRRTVICHVQTMKSDLVLLVLRVKSKVLVKDLYSSRRRTRTMLLVKVACGDYQQFLCYSDTIRYKEREI